MDQSCGSPLTPERIAAFERANALNHMASNLLLSGYTFEAAVMLLEASRCDISRAAKAVLRERAKALADELHMKAWGLSNPQVTH